MVSALTQLDQWHSLPPYPQVQHLQDLSTWTMPGLSANPLRLCFFYWEVHGIWELDFSKISFPTELKANDEERAVILRHFMSR